MANDKTLLELADITQMYVTRQHRFTALKHINMSIKEGDFVALLGPSGCGKSTLLRIITGLQQATFGKVIYKGKELVGVNQNATIVFQSFALFPWLTVLDNVEVALEAKSFPKKMRTTKALDLLDRVGLDGFENAYPRELSGGMRQKVGFARAMAVDPELLCLDEPFSALDVLSAESLRSDLLELWIEGKIPCKAILLVTHNIEEAVTLADRILVMEKDPGRVVKEINIDMKHPREYDSPTFKRYMDEIYETLAGKTRPRYIEAGAAPGQGGGTRLLPNIKINTLATFLEHLSETETPTYELYKLEEELGVDSEQIINLTEFAELLGFATVESGEITLTHAGREFAEADMQKRKEIFAIIIRELPTFKWMLQQLNKSERKRLKKDVIISALELEFPEKEAAEQVDNLINLGRYAELIAYDDNNEMIYLESPQSVLELLEEV
jgi:NitT/TauT family transport system ATP-binding protein